MDTENKIAKGYIQTELVQMRRWSQKVPFI